MPYGNENAQSGHGEGMQWVNTGKGAVMWDGCSGSADGYRPGNGYGNYQAQGHGTGDGEGATHTSHGSQDIRLQIETHMLEKAFRNNLLPLITFDSLEFYKSKSRLEQLLKQGV